MLTWPKASMMPSYETTRLATARSCLACASGSAMCFSLEFETQQMIDRDQPAAVDQEIQRPDRPHRRIFKAHLVPEPAVVFEVIEGRQRHQQKQRQRHRPREQAERDARRRDELGEHRAIGPEPAGPEAL